LGALINAGYRFVSPDRPQRPKYMFDTACFQSAVNRFIETS